MFFWTHPFRSANSANCSTKSWLLKRQLSNRISTPAIDEIYESGREAGAIGGKLLGAGGGGFMVFLVEPAKRQSVRERLSKLIEVSVDFENEGSKIVLYEPEDFR